VALRTVRRWEKLVEIVRMPESGRNRGVDSGTASKKSIDTVELAVQDSSMDAVLGSAP